MSSSSSSPLNAAILTSCLCLKQSPFDCTGEMAPAALGKTKTRYDCIQEALVESNRARVISWKDGCQSYRKARHNEKAKAGGNVLQTWGNALL